MLLREQETASYCSRNLDDDGDLHLSLQAFICVRNRLKSVTSLSVGKTFAMDLARLLCNELSVEVIAARVGQGRMHVESMGRGVGS